MVSSRGSGTVVDEGLAEGTVFVAGGSGPRVHSDEGGDVAVDFDFACTDDVLGFAPRGNVCLGHEFLESFLHKLILNV